MEHMVGITVSSPLTWYLPFNILTSEFVGGNPTRQYYCNIWLCLQLEPLVQLQLIISTTLLLLFAMR